MYFDVRTAKQLAPGQHLLMDGCNGLRLVASNTYKSWTYRYKDASGRMKQVGLGRWPAVSAAQAAARWSELVAGRESGQDPVQAKRQAKTQAASDDAAAVTVRQLVQAFIAGPLRDSRAQAGFVAAQRALQRVLDAEPALASQPAQAVTRSQAFAVIDGRKATAAAKLRALLGAAWEFGNDSGLLLGGKHQGRQRRVLHSGEVAALLRWLPTMHQTAADAVVLYLWTATRGAEIFAMRPEHFAQNARGQWWWTVPKMLTKNARFDAAVDLRVPLFGRALQVVQCRCEHIGQTGLLFETMRGKPYTQHDLSTYIYDLQPYLVKSQARPQRDTLPVVGWSPHRLRKTTRTLLAELGCPNEVGEAIVGHMPAEIVGTYNAYSYNKEHLHWLAALSDYATWYKQAQHIKRRGSSIYA